MLDKFKAHIDSKFSFFKKSRVLVACSGGLDSVVLAKLCQKAAIDITLAHCNFKLRGEESNADEAFVKKLAKDMRVDVLVRAFDTLGYINQHGGSVQMAARTLRYEWFHVLLKQNFDYVLTAHHADDNLETFLINLSRGTGIEGLTGIQEINGKIVRPFLPFSRMEIEAYAKSNNINWREDGSNSETKYLRNKIRLELVPKLKELHPAFLDNFNATQSYLNQTESLAENHISEVKKKLFEEKGNDFHIKIKKLKRYAPLEAYLYGLFNEYGFQEWDNLKNLLDASSGKSIFSATHRLLKDRKYLILSQRNQDISKSYKLDATTKEITEPIRLQLEIASKIEEKTPNIAYLDKEKLNFPLELRKWKKGDYFYPFGMKGKKKLSKYFKDEKVDVISKEKQWLLTSNNEIVWIIGRRIDERFKVEPKTENIVRITYSP